MGQISGAIIGVTVVLISVFVPLAFFSGSVGNIYRQFSAVMVASIAFSAFMALSLTPALCATLLKPVRGRPPPRQDAASSAGSTAASRAPPRATRAWWRGMLPRAGALPGDLRRHHRPALRLVYLRLPTSFLPNEDQGYMLVNVQLPPGATQERTLAVMQQVEGFMLKQPEVQSMVGVLGFSFSGQGQNAALAFVTLKDWDERRAPGSSAQALAGRAFGALMGIRDAFIFPLSPPPIPELGTASGFTFRLQDRGGHGHDALLAARNQLLGMAAQEQAARRRCAPTAWKTRRSCSSTSTATRPARWAWASTRINAAHLHRAGLGLRQRLPQRRAACSAWWCRPMRRRACSPTTCCA